MLYGLREKEKVLALPKMEANCPGCGGQLVPKCGQIKVWHWAHKTSDCDWDSKPETQWHLEWKSQFPSAWCEVKVGDYRADVLLPNGTAIEFQHSSISMEDIRSRTENYPKIVWMFNGRPYEDNFYFRDKGTYFTFVWDWARPTYQALNQSFYIDFEKRIFRVRKLYRKNGWGEHAANSKVEWIDGLFAPKDMLDPRYPVYMDIIAHRHRYPSPEKQAAIPEGL